MKAGGHAGPLAVLRPQTGHFGWWGRLALLPFLLAMTAFAGPGLNADSPVGFFTNLASRLLKSETNLELTHIQIWPTNQYTPAVHRLLQLTANIYDATTNRFNDAYPHLPTIFRPRFTNEGGDIYISGYVEETNTAFLSHTLRDVVSTDVANAVQPDDLIFGVPLVIGAKKGFPNFNEFAMESVFQITRKVQLIKGHNPPGGPEDIVGTNQMFIIGISNAIGVEFWNSYSSDYTNPVDIHVTNFIMMELTNDYGVQLQTNLIVGASLETNLWPSSLSDLRKDFQERGSYIVCDR